MKKANSKKIVFLGGKGLGIQVLKYLQETDDVVGIVTNVGDDDAVWHTPLFATVPNLDNIVHWADNINLLVDQIKKLKPDYLICHGYDTILKKDILNVVPKGHAINLHTGLIDQFRGRYPTVYPILDGCGEAGVTIHVMTPDVDAGSVYAQAKVAVDEMDTAETLYYKCLGAGLNKFQSIWPDIKSGKLKPKPLDISKSKLITKKDFPSFEIDLSWDEDKIDRIVRALSFGPFKRPYFVINGKKFGVVYRGGRE